MAAPARPAAAARRRQWRAGRLPRLRCAEVSCLPAVARLAPAALLWSLASCRPWAPPPTIPLLPSPAAVAAPVPGQPFAAYLAAELRPGPSYPTADVVWGQTERDRVYNALVAVPYQLERFLLFGVAVCLDSFLVGAASWAAGWKGRHWVEEPLFGSLVLLG